MGNILVIGGTGNMGRPLVKSLVESGHCVSVVCRRKVDEEDVRRLASNSGVYYYGDAKDRKFMEGILERYYDAIVDFCIYTSEEFRERMSLFLDKTDQYVCLSTAAVYSDTPTPKNELSSRYLEVDPPQQGTDKWNWYCYEKARIEDMLFNSGERNWTIVRPGITMNANHIGWGLWWDDAWVGRVIRGKKVVVEEDMLDFRFSISSGRQVASLIGSLIGNQRAMGEVFNVCSSQVWSWREMLDIYTKIFQRYGYRLKAKYINSWVVLKKFPSREYWYKRARLLDRVFDNSKVFSIASPQISGESMAELLDEWTEDFIKNNKHNLVADSVQLRQTVELDKLTSDCSRRSDFCSLRIYVIYLLMRYCPMVLTVYSKISGLVHSAMRCVRRG